MEPQPVVHSTFVIQRSFTKQPQRVFAAFADPAKKRRWYAESENKDIDEFETDFRVGGTERTRYRHKQDSRFAGVVFTSESIYQSIVPDRRIVSASTMAYGDHRFSAALITVELLPTGQGTDLVFTHQGAFFEGSDGPQMREAGWRALLDRLQTELAS